MKYFFAIAFLFLFGCNSNHQPVNPETTESKCHIYPSSIDSLHLQDLYDSAKWYIYTKYCDVLYRPKSDTLLSRSFGELELKFDNFIIKNDTAVLFFDFINDKGQPILPGMMKEYKQLATGIGFDIKTRKKTYILTSNVTIIPNDDPKSRYVNPMQPEVKKYIKENWDKIDDCFRELAEQKGINK